MLDTLFYDLCFSILLKRSIFYLVTEGKRYSLPNSRIMIHQPLGGAQGGQTDIDIQVGSLSGFFNPLSMAFKKNYNLYM